MRFRPTHIVVHESASEYGDAESIRRYHVDVRKYKDCGYHKVILNGYRNSRDPYNPALDGKVEDGRPETMFGAHCSADGMNFKALGVCLIGYPGKRGYPTKRQIDSLILTLAKLCIRYSIPYWRISQHSDHDPRKPLCASLDMKSIREQVNYKIQQLKPE